MDKTEYFRNRFASYLHKLVKNYKSNRAVSDDYMEKDVDIGIDIGVKKYTVRDKFAHGLYVFLNTMSTAGIVFASKKRREEFMRPDYEDPFLPKDKITRDREKKKKPG